MYQALYRKWRPRCFSDVSGQSHVTKTLSREIAAGKLSHAYLFTGSRGTGKTTCAKILAKAVNCLSPVDGDPCNECEICKGIDAGSVLDVIEIDAASNNGVDNIRDLREEANFTPVKAKYRVYIIDEVHMLSIGAFNALLKILEEPPAHVIFILATTEVHKLPATILSRCQRFDFKHISIEDIIARLQYVSEQEHIVLHDDAAALIARIADGALRDALSLLDRCSANGSDVTAEVVSRCAGLAGRDYLQQLTLRIREKDTAGALSMLQTLHSASCNMEVLCGELLEYFRNLMILKTAPHASDLILTTAQELDEMRQLCEGFTLADILRDMTLIETSVGNLKRGLNKRIETEMLLVRLCAPALDPSPDALTQRVAALEQALTRLQQQGVAAPIAARPAAVQTPTPLRQAPPAPQADVPPSEKPTEKKPVAEKPSTERPVPEDPVAGSAPTTDAPQAFSAWASVVQALSVKNNALASMLSMARAFQSGNSVLIRSNHPMLPMMLATYMADLQAAADQVTGQHYVFRVADSADAQQEENPFQRFRDQVRKFNQE